MSSDHSPTREGFVGAVVMRLSLLLIVLGEVGYLASRYDLRVDLTSDKIYTLTASTRTVLAKLDDLLLIEAYFSPKGSLPLLLQPDRAQMVSILEEYEELGSGRVKVQYIDPLENQAVRNKAIRLGIMPTRAQDSRSAGTRTESEIWQGLRIRYGAKKQQVIPHLKFPPRRANDPHMAASRATSFYEWQLTPLIKLLTIEERPKVGVLAFRSRPGGPGLVIDLDQHKTPPFGFDFLLQSPILNTQYDLRPIDIRFGQLIPPEIEIALLVRPKFLSDRTKFIFDQFLMRGGKLVVFVDACEVEVRYNRALRGSFVPYDGPASKLSFLEMLRTYGVDVENKIIGEGIPDQHQWFYDLHLDSRTGRTIVRNLQYPFMFEARNHDWKGVAGDMARGDSALARLYQDAVLPGMTIDHELIQALAGNGAPGMFWPCPVGLTEELPEGVQGKVLLRTSPVSWVEPPNAALDPYGEAFEPQLREDNYRRWYTSKESMHPATPMQFPLMVHLTGPIPSFFADKPIPEAPGEKPAKPAAEDWGRDPDVKDAKKPDPDAKELGPEPAKQAVEEPVAAESKLDRAVTSASLLVIGDATFIRDDFITGRYREPNQEHDVPIGGPLDKEGGRAQLFCKNLLDWLCQEDDLLALQNKRPTERAIKLGVRNEAQQETQAEFNQRLRNRQSLLRGLNMYGPALFLFLLGMGVLFQRRRQKRFFLAGHDS